MRDSQGRVAAFRQGLQEVGWSEGRNLLITSRWSAGDNDSIRAAASNLSGSKPDVLLVNGRRGLVALQQETPIIPIVFADPVEPASVASLARPGGNITGFAFIWSTHRSTTMWDCSKSLHPVWRRVAIVMSSDAPNDADRFRISENTASRFRIKPVVMPVIDAAEIERAVAAVRAREPDGGLLVPADAGITVHCDLIDRGGSALPIAGDLSLLGHGHQRRPDVLRGGRGLSLERAAAPMLVAFSRARSPASFRFRRRPNSSWSSISRLRRRSASTVPLERARPRRRGDRMMKRREFITLLSGNSVAAGGTRAVADSAKSLHGTCAGFLYKELFPHGRITQ